MQALATYLIDTKDASIFQAKVFSHTFISIGNAHCIK